jgi:hypothetical protein
MNAGYGKYKIIFLLLSLLMVLITSGQDSIRISGNFSGYSFKQLTREIESKTSFFFYYNTAELDSMPVNLNADKMLIKDVLKYVFKNTSFKYVIDPFNRILVTKLAVIHTSLASGFFNRVSVSKEPITEMESYTSGAVIKNEKIKTAADNKLYEIGIKSGNNQQGNATLAGYVRDIKNGEAVVGASIYIDTPNIGVTADQFGYYTITLPKGRHILHINSVGMKDAKRQLVIYGDGKLTIELETFVASLRTVTVIAEKKSNIKSLQMGVERMTIKTIKQIPVVLGEADILRAVLTLPGVTSVGEASTGFNVRGGSVDQNLILFNDATIYNPSHLFGFFTAFHPDLIKGVELYKSTIPEKYGGRLSSVLDINTREGNNKKWSAMGGISPLTSKFLIEGPLVKEKTSLIFGGRTTYSNWLLRNLRNQEYNRSRASFYDLSLHISHTINNKNQLYITGYWSNDEFKLNNDTLYKYGNRNIIAKWKHNFNNRLFAVVTTGIDNYKYSLSANQNPVTGFNLNFQIKQQHFRTEFTYSPGNKHQFNFGINSIYYQLNPGKLTPFNNQSLVDPETVPAERAMESAIYVGDRFSVNSRLSVNAGIRLSLFNYLGPQAINTYLPGLPRETATIKETIDYESGKIIKSYIGPEYRLAFRYAFTDNASVKLAFNSLRQYIHTLSNTTAISPIDIWKLSDPSIQPQMGNQLSLGFYRNFKSNTIETFLEVYYKRIKNYLDFKSGATLVLNKNVETEVISTRGKAYGAELLLKKTSGKLNGWLSYTYSRILLQMNDPIAGELINNGKYYPANYDKPHSVNFIGNYRFTHRFSASLSVIYSTGRPVTLPIALFNQGGAQRVLYSDRNQYRIPDYFRTDFSINIEGNHKVKQVAHNSWSLGIYNLLARENAYSVYFVQENGRIKGYQLSVFGTLIPFVTYNFKF